MYYYSHVYLNYLLSFHWQHIVHGATLDVTTIVNIRGCRSEAYYLQYHAIYKTLLWLVWEICLTTLKQTPHRCSQLPGVRHGLTRLEQTTGPLRLKRLFVMMHRRAWSSPEVVFLLNYNVTIHNNSHLETKFNRGPSSSQVSSLPSK